MVWYWVGKRTEVLSASRKNGNRQPEELGGWGKAPECIRDLGGEKLSGFNGRDLRGNALHWREETCKAHLQQKDRASICEGLPSQSQNSDPYLFLSERTAEMEKENNVRKRGTAIGPKWDPA